MSEEDTELQIFEFGRISVRNTVSYCAILVFFSGQLLLATVRDRILGLEGSLVRLSFYVMDLEA